jgi:hypothetical protein
MKVSQLILILQQHDPAAVVVLSMCPEESSSDRDAVAVDRMDICSVQLRAIDAGEYRKRYVVAVEGDVPGVWLG